MATSELVTIYISIGNSDNKLSQHQWANFHNAVSYVVCATAKTVWGEWVSESTSEFQNACWGVAVYSDAIPNLKAKLAQLAHVYKQDAIMWAEVTNMETITPATGNFTHRSDAINVEG